MSLLRNAYTQADDVPARRRTRHARDHDHAPHTPFWVDLTSHDIEAATRFYGQLFDWAARQDAGPEMRSYTVFTLTGKSVAGLFSPMVPGQPSAWNVYIASDNVDRVAESVQTAGGAVMMEPDDIPGAGHMGFFRDPTGAAFGVMQPREHTGADVVREPNAFTWAELQTRDVAAVTPFYQQVFGWGAKSSPIGPGQPEYTEWTLNGESVGGAMPMQAAIPATVPPHWLAYFQVENADRSAARVTELGGQILTGPHDFPGGRFAVISDPHGAAFGILEART